MWRGRIVKPKRKSTVSDLREYEFCSVSWCISKDIGGYSREAASKNEKALLDKHIKSAERAKVKGNRAHNLYDAIRGIGILFFLIASGLLLWIIFKVI